MVCVPGSFNAIVGATTCSDAGAGADVTGLRLPFPAKTARTLGYVPAVAIGGRPVLNTTLAFPSLPTVPIPSDWAGSEVAPAKNSTRMPRGFVTRAPVALSTCARSVIRLPMTTGFGVMRSSVTAGVALVTVSEIGGAESAARYLVVPPPNTSGV